LTTSVNSRGLAGRRMVVARSNCSQIEIQSKSYRICNHRLAEPGGMDAPAGIRTRDLAVTIPPVSLYHAARVSPRTSCARGDTVCLRPLQVDNIFVFIRQMAPVPACWLFKTSATSCPLTF